MEIIYNLSIQQLEQLHQLYKQEWWAAERTLKETQKCVNGSQISIACVDQDQRLIGFVRVITDFTFKALVLDLIISKPYRGRGLADTLMHLVTSHKELLNVKHFELYCRPELEKFYARYGFSTELGNIRLMRLTNSVSTLV